MSNPLVEIEQQILKFWRKQNIFAQSLEQRAGRDEFVFYEGPPTANAKPGIHHMIARAYKDIILRYKTQRGYLVKRRAGWDTHGLPVEVQVEKALSLHNKQEIENLVPGDRLASIAKFNQQCKESVWQYTKDWEKFTERMGYWLDFEHAYITYDRGYVEYLWSMIKHIYDEEMLVKSHKVVPYCPRCGTPLSSHEVAQEYQDVTDRTVYAKFAVADEPNTYFLAWTTTPWTLPGNVALAVGKDIEYVLAREGDNQYYLAADLMADVLSDEAEEIGRFKGKELVGKKYHPLFAIPALAKEKNVYTVIAAPFVTTEEGTGIVHTAAMYGVEDYDEAVKQDLPRIHTVGEDGRFLDLVPGLAGKLVGESTEEIVAHLEKNNTLYAEEEVTHSYPFCWRCKSRLLYYAKDSWFITMTKKQAVLIAMNEKVNWVPAHLREGRYGEWLRELRDWAFSRERYWGTPLPIWTHRDENGQEDFLVVGSVAELKELAEDKDLIGDDFDPHRPNVDQVILNKEGKQYHFEGVIADVWFDSGSMPFASGEDDQGRYPADYISEAVDQTRGWFYTLQAVAVLMGKTNSPYKNVVSLGHINDEHGKKMSKSLGNIIEPMAAGDTYGMDAIRFYMYAMNQPGVPKRFSTNDLLTSYRKNQQLLLNICHYLTTYRPANFNYQADHQSEVLLDKWIICRLNQLANQVAVWLDNYQITEAARSTTEALNDLSQWYLRRSRDRKDDDLFNTLTYSLKLFSQIMAPFTPFIAEHVWQEIRDAEDLISVHLTDWPPDLTVDEELLTRMQTVRQVAMAGHALRQEAKLKVRQPLTALAVQVPAEMNLAGLTDLLAAELNVGEIKLVPVKQLGWPQTQVTLDQTVIEVALDTKLTPELKKEADKREITRAWQDGRKQAGLEPGEMATVKFTSVKSLADDELAEVGKAIQLKTAAGELAPEAKAVKLTSGEKLFFSIEKSHGDAL